MFDEANLSIRRKDIFDDNNEQVFGKDNVKSSQEMKQIDDKDEETQGNTTIDVHNANNDKSMKKCQIWKNYK